MDCRPVSLTNTSLAAYLPDEAELSERFIRSSGAGGQHVNRSATAVQLRFDAVNSPSLPPAVRSRLFKLAGQRIDQDGVITIQASEHRSQYRNRQDARTRLAQLIRQAHQVPKPRRKTQPSKAQKKRRIETKKRRSQTLKLRKKPNPTDG